MTHAERTFVRAFITALLVQFGLYLLFFFFGASWSVSETAFQKAYLFFYWPVIYVAHLVQKGLEIDGWGAIVFLLFIAPIIGGIFYSILFGFATSVYSKKARRRQNLPDLPETKN